MNASQDFHLRSTAYHDLASSMIMQTDAHYKALRDLPQPHTLVSLDEEELERRNGITKSLPGAIEIRAEETEGEFRILENVDPRFLIAPVLASGEKIVIQASSVFMMDMDTTRNIQRTFLVDRETSLLRFVLAMCFTVHPDCTPDQLMLRVSSSTGWSDCESMDGVALWKQEDWINKNDKRFSSFNIPPASQKQVILLQVDVSRVVDGAYVPMILQQTDEVASSLTGHLSAKWYEEGLHTAVSAPTRYFLSACKWILDVLERVNGEDQVSASTTTKVLLEASLKAKPWEDIVEELGIDRMVDQDSVLIREWIRSFTNAVERTTQQIRDLTTHSTEMMSLISEGKTPPEIMVELENLKNRQEMMPRTRAAPGAQPVFRLLVRKKFVLDKTTVSSPVI